MNAIDLQKEVSLAEHRNAKYDLICNLADSIELEDGIFQWSEIESQNKFNIKGFKNFIWLGLALLCFCLALFLL